MPSSPCATPKEDASLSTVPPHGAEAHLSRGDPQPRPQHAPGGEVCLPAPTPLWVNKTRGPVTPRRAALGENVAGRRANTAPQTKDALLSDPPRSGASTPARVGWGADSRSLSPCPTEGCVVFFCGGAEPAPGARGDVASDSGGGRGGRAAQQFPSIAEPKVPLSGRGAGKKDAEGETRASGGPRSHLTEQPAAEGGPHVPEARPASPKHGTTATASSLPTLNVKGCVTCDTTVEQHPQPKPSSGGKRKTTTEKVGTTAGSKQELAGSTTHDTLPACSRIRSTAAKTPVSREGTMYSAANSPPPAETQKTMTLRTSLSGQAPASHVSAKVATPPNASAGCSEGQMVDKEKKRNRATLVRPIKKAYASIVSIFGRTSCSQSALSPDLFSPNRRKAALSVEVLTPPNGSPARATIQREKSRKNSKHKETVSTTVRTDGTGKKSVEVVPASAVQHESSSSAATADTTGGGNNTLRNVQGSSHSDSSGRKSMRAPPPPLSPPANDVAGSATAVSASLPPQRGSTPSIRLSNGDGTDSDGTSSAPGTPQTPVTAPTGSSGAKGGQTSATAAASPVNGASNLSPLSAKPPAVAPDNPASATTSQLAPLPHGAANGDTSVSVRLPPARKPRPLYSTASSSAKNIGGMGAGTVHRRSIGKKRERAANQLGQRPKQLQKLSAIEKRTPSQPILSSVINSNTPSIVLVAGERWGLDEQLGGENVPMSEKMAKSSSPRPVSTVGQNGGPMEDVGSRNLSTEVSSESIVASLRGADWPTDSSSTHLPLTRSTPSLSRSVSIHDVQLATLSQYAHRTEVDLSMSTFTAIGAHLSLSQTIRVINLKGCTMNEEGLRGLAEIPTLQVVCVSHMRQLKSLRPLIERRSGLFADIEEIDAQCTPIQNEGIAGLEKMRRLRRLCLSMTRLTDVTPLSASRSLQHLTLTSSPVTSDGIAGLERIPTLKTLNISRTKVQSLRGLYRSESLETLIVYSCKVTNDDLIRLARMPRLEVLDVSTTKVTDLSTLRGSASLKRLTAQWLQLINCRDMFVDRQSSHNGEAHAKSRRKEEEHSKKNALTPLHLGKCSTNTDAEAGFRGLANIPTLEHVDLSHCAIQSVRSLFVSRSIKSLILRRTCVESDGIKGIGNMRSLQTLVISNVADNFCVEEGSEWSSVSGVFASVTELPNVLTLAILDLSFTDVYDLRMLSALPCLRELRLVETLITVDGIRGIEKLPSLCILDISQTSIISLQFLSAGCQQLQQLFVRANRNARGFRIGNLHTLPSLEVLDVSDTVVEDMKMLFRLTCRLKRLIWRWGERRDVRGLIEPLPCCVKTPALEGLEIMPWLELLDITNTAVTSVSFLAQSRSLRWLNLSRCQALDNDGIAGLQNIRTLEELDLSQASGITDVSCLATSPSLRGLRLGWTGVTLDGLRGLRAVSTLTSLDITSTPADCERTSEDKAADTAGAPGGDKRGPLNETLLCALNPLMRGGASHVLPGRRQTPRVSFLL